MQAQFNGTQCEAAHGASRPAACINPTPCPVDCVGGWQTAGACQGPCGRFTNGSLPEIFNVTVPAAHQGMQCPSVHGATRSSTLCTTAPCPVSCRAVWAPIGGCTGQCGGGLGSLDEVFLITQSPLWGGQVCEFEGGSQRSGVLACQNTDLCPVDCVGSYVQLGNCSGTCGTQGQGLLPEVYVVSTPAVSTGQACSTQTGTVRATKPCVNQTPCP